MEEGRRKKITKAILDDLTAKAKASSRLRMNLDLRDSEDDQSQPVVVLNIPAGQWHTLRALESGSVILEMKDGKFEPLSDVDILK